MTRRNYTDWTFTSLQALTPFYRGGWGDRGVIDQVRAAFLDPGPPRDIDIRWAHEENNRGAIVREGYFESPADVPLPARARTAWFQMLMPPHSPDLRPPVVIHLAATADQGYRHRRRLAQRLLYRGIGSVILENPYYGKRRPRGQLGVALATVADQLMMNHATIDEARALLSWLTSRGHPAVGVTGYSMGGFMTAYTAALHPEPVVAVPCAAGLSPGFPFLHTNMSKVPDWRALRRGESDPKGRFEELLAGLSIEKLSAPVDAESAVVLGADHDVIVPPEQSIALHRHWKGSRLRWLGAGHITGFILRMGTISDAIYDGFAIRLYKDGGPIGPQ